MRSSREATQKHRQEIIDASARLFREKGAEGVSVPELMQAVGLTHGGFYKHFSSKEELVAAAYRNAFDQIVERLEAAAAEHRGDRAEAWNATVSSYLSAAHRDSAGAGCAAAALAGDAARLEGGSAAKAAFEKGVKRMLDQLASLREGEDATDENLVALSTLVGALLLARGTDGALSEAFLQSAREHLVKPARG